MIAVAQGVGIAAEGSQKKSLFYTIVVKKSHSRLIPFFGGKESFSFCIGQIALFFSNLQILFIGFGSLVIAVARNWYFAASDLILIVSSV